MYRSKTIRPPQKAHLPPTGVKVWPHNVDGKEQPDVSDPSQAWRTKQRRIKIGLPGHRMVTLGQVLIALAGVWIALLLLFLLWWRPSLGFMGGATGVGMIVGLLLTYIYYQNVRRKAQLQQVLSMDPGLKGCQYLLGTLPSWISLTEREKMEWLNRMLSEMWPYYDRGICKLVKEIVEPIIEQYRPPTFKRIFFEELTFGEAPFRIEGISVRDLKDEIDMEVDVRWCGDANISLGIDLPLPGPLGDFTRLTPKVKDIVFVATLKIMFKPLVEQVPGFAAAAFALKTLPIISYRLDFGAVPSTVTTIVTAPIRGFVDFIINQVLVGMLVWPKRFPIPLLSWNGFLPANDPDIDLEVERLSGRPRGVIKINIIQAKDLKNCDTLGKSDPFVEIFTTQDHRSCTRAINNTLTPQWNETKYLPVIEADTVLRVEMFDRDTINITSLAGLKSMAALEAGKEFMGRCALPLTQFINEEGLEDELWLPLGKGSWTNLEGPGQGEGWIKLGLQYRALENIGCDEVLHAIKGLLMVGVIRCYDLSRNAKMSSYVTVKLSGGKETSKEVFKTATMKATNCPRWANDNKFTLYDVSAQDILSVSVMEPSIAIDGEIGTVYLPVSKIIANKQTSRWTKVEETGYMYDDFGIGGEHGQARIELEIEFLPYW